MSVQVSEEMKNIQELFSKGKYQTIYDQYASVLRDMLFVDSLEEWQDFIQQGGSLEEEPLRLHLSAEQGECLCLGGYEGECTQAVLDFLASKLPDTVSEQLKSLNQAINVDMDEWNQELEYLLKPYEFVSAQSGHHLRVEFDDTYCAGVYFLFVDIV